MSKKELALDLAAMIGSVLIVLVAWILFSACALGIVFLIGFLLGNFIELFTGDVRVLGISLDVVCGLVVLTLSIIAGAFRR